MALTTVISVIVAAVLIPPLWSLIKNYREAKKVGVPVIVTPIVTLHPLTFLLGPLLFPIMKRLPGPFSQWAKFGNHFWMIGDAYRTHAQLGPVFAVVSPGATSLFISDHVAGEKLLSRTKEFIKPPVIYSSIEVYGPNVDTVNGDTWNRHRRITTPPFNERNSDLVWQESLRQAKGLLEEWTGKGENGGADTKKDTMKVALHVLSSAGFGQGHDFQGGVMKLSQGHEMTYAGALSTILGDVMATFTVSQVPFSLGFLPRFRLAGQALAEFKKYMVEMVDEERRLIEERGPKDNLMSVLVRSADASKESGGARNSLSDEEIFGNLFIWNLAGHDTTAGALSFAITLLSVHPEIQNWIREEINTVFKGVPLEKWNYEEAFPRLKRCLALMYETLRLNLPAPSMPKQTGDMPQTLRISDKEYQIPAGWHVALNLVAVHTDPYSWGDDALVWNPPRFIQRPADANGAEELVLPSPASAFVPWASGPRVCPGRKFAQVEFVAVIACLFRAHKLRPARLQGESADGMRARVLDVVADSSITKSVTLAMNHPERVRFVWEKV